MNITEIADELYRELDEPTDLNIPAIAFWLQSNIGYLNILINTCFELHDDGSISPELNAEAKEIYKLIYVIKFYGRRISQNLGASGVQIKNITQVVEGNRRVTIQSKTENAKILMLLRSEYQTLLNQLTDLYKRNLSFPRHVVGDDTVPGFPGRYYGTYWPGRVYGEPPY